MDNFLIGLVVVQVVWFFAWVYKEERKFSKETNAIFKELGDKS
jgi:hypothetical protein